MHLVRSYHIAVWFFKILSYRFGQVVGKESHWSWAWKRGVQSRDPSGPRIRGPAQPITLC